MKKMANGMGSVVKWKSREKYYVFAPAVRHYDPETKKARFERKVLKTFPLTKNGYMEAVSFLAEYNRDPALYNAKNLTLEQIFNMWKREESYKSLSNSRREGLNGAWVKYCLPIKDFAVGNIKRYILQKIVDDCPFGYGTKSMISSLFSHLFQYAVVNEIIPTNVAFKLSVGRGYQPSIERNLFTADEVNRLWGELNARNSDIVRFALILLYTGMRRSEILTVSKSSVNLEERYMVGGLKSTAGRGRVIPLHKDILPIIRKIYDLSDETLLDYIPSRGKKGNLLSIRFDTLMKSLGMNHTPHDCRFTFVSRMDELGAKDLLVKKAIGHSMGDITKDIYTKIDASKLVETIDILYY